VLRKSVKIGQRSFTVVVYRCGFNYRLVGFDLIRNRIYEGSVFQQEVQAMLDKYVFCYTLVLPSFSCL
jgi:hypothetical protein